MAVFQGARLRTSALPARAGRRGVRGAPPAVRPARIRPTTALMGTILAATMLGLVYLTQTLGSNAASAEIIGLEGERQDLGRQLRNQVVAVQFAADPVQVGLRAKRLGLVRLGDPDILSAP